MIKSTLRAIHAFLIHRVIADEGDRCKDKPYGMLYASAVGPNGNMLFNYARTCLDPVHDWKVIETAIMFGEAIIKRNVDITPDVLYKYMMGKEYVKPGADEEVNQIGHEMILPRRWWQRGLR